MLLYAIIFISGAAILALELLASRIMTPYFGVSLYIWTGILSITLVSLALGYWLGGRLAARANPGRLLQLFTLMPALAAIALVGACLAYPQLFPLLANWHLVLGAFVACLVLLFLPLVAASAMNPLLVAIRIHAQRTARAADAGAGKVFFVSTIGSVAGVFLTAYALIPFISNFAAVLIVSLILASLALAAVILAQGAFAGKGAVAVLAAAAAICAATLLWNADAYTGRVGPYMYNGALWRLEASHSSLFGTVKVLRKDAEAQSGRFERMYFQDGLTQNTVDSNHRSTSFYTYALEALARGFRPRMQHALVLGLGAGMVPMRLADLGVKVETVEIDAVSRIVAERYFGFDTRKVPTHEADARTYLRGCAGAYDLIVIDLFHGDGTPDYLVTRDFFRDLRTCLTQDGIAVFNTFADLDRPQGYAHFLATLKAELPHFALYRPHYAGSTHVNSFVVASGRPLPALEKVTFDHVPPGHQETLWNMLSAPVPHTPALLAGGRVISDAINPAAHDHAELQLVFRKSVVEGTPAAMLVN